MYPFAAEDIRTEDTATPGVLAIYGDPLDGGAPALIGIARARIDNPGSWGISVVHGRGIGFAVAADRDAIPLAAARMLMTASSRAA